MARLMGSGLIGAGIVVFASAAAGAAQAGAEIPAAFHGAGCNLKYTYARAPKGDATDCFSAKAYRKDGEGPDGDNFIRISGTRIAGFEWGCDVKTVKAMSETELTFTGNCGDEGTEYDGTVTLLLRPGRQVIIDQIVEGRHIIDIYRLRDDLQ